MKNSDGNHAFLRDSTQTYREEEVFSRMPTNQRTTPHKVLDRCHNVVAFSNQKVSLFQNSEKHLITKLNMKRSSLHKRDQHSPGFLTFLWECLGVSPVLASSIGWDVPCQVTMATWTCPTAKHETPTDVWLERVTTSPLNCAAADAGRAWTTQLWDYKGPRRACWLDWWSTQGGGLWVPGVKHHYCGQAPLVCG